MKHAWLLAALACGALAQNGVTVRGTVIDTVGGKPVAGATVVLEGAEDSYVVESDSSGRFHADDVVPGKYDARAEREGYTAPPRAKRHVRFTMEGGQPAPAIELRLVPLGAISGRIVDGDGDPVSRAMVEAQVYSYADGRRELKTVERAMSDDRGEYRLSGLVPGGYYLRASGVAPFGRSMFPSLDVLGEKPAYELMPAYFPSADEVESAVLVELRAGGDLRDHTITLRTAQTYTLRITLNGSADAGGRTTLGLMFPTGGGMMMDARNGAQRPFPNLKPGTYIVSGQDRTLELVARQAVKISNADVDVTLTPRPEGTLHGSVRVNGNAVKPDAVRVRMDASDLPELSEGPVASDGTFALPHLRAVPYRLSVMTPAGSYLEGVRVGERMVTDPVMDMGRIGGLVEIVLATNGGMLEGVVVDAEGTPVEGAVAVAAPLGAMREWSALVRSSATDAEGRFVLRDLAPGEYQVLAFLDAAEGAPLNAEFRKRYEARAVAVTMEAGGRETIKVKGIE